MNTEYRGRLQVYFETGMEGVKWALQCDENPDLGGLVILKAGDYLSVHSPSNVELFTGEIAPNYEACKRLRPGSDYAQPQVAGLWVHWTQNDYDSQKWAELFISGDNSAVVRRKARKG